jgi:aminopeptidase N
VHSRFHRFRPPAAFAGAVLTALVLLASCAGGDREAHGTAGLASLRPDPDRGDVHSFAEPDRVTVRHLELDLTVDFDTRTFAGHATLTIEPAAGATRLVLDTMDLAVDTVAVDGVPATDFVLGEVDPVRGRPLTVPITPGSRSVRVSYRTAPDAAALMWLDPSQTDAGLAPFVFSQNQPNLARSWIPCQDSPAVRATYDATIRVPEGVLPVMSASGPVETGEPGAYRFTMAQPIPAYLIAIAVGALEFRALDERTGVYAEPTVIEAAAWEFAETPEMMDLAETLYGPYRWERYDVLVLPPAFPFGGMENPRLTFLTPTVIAGDRSLVALIAHELAHSWSGNLVTNARWEDLWLNEGFTVYFEHRIMEALSGADYVAMLVRLGLDDLEATVAEMGADDPDTRLVPDLAGRDPDDGMSDVAYEKGALFLHRLERAFGRERWDAFLREYFDRHAFRSMTTERFLAELDRELLAPHPEIAARIDVDAWVWGTGIPEDRPRFPSTRFDAVRDTLAALRDGTPAAELDVRGWTTHEWLFFLRGLPDPVPTETLAELDGAFDLTSSGNAEILNVWFQAAIRAGYAAADPAIDAFLQRVGRRKFLRPIYEALAETDAGRERGRRILERARDGYHGISIRTIEEILGASAIDG